MDAECRICEVCIEEEYVVVVYVLSGWLLLQDTFLATCQTLKRPTQLVVLYYIVRFSLSLNTHHDDKLTNLR